MGRYGQVMRLRLAGAEGGRRPPARKAGMPPARTSSRRGSLKHIFILKINFGSP